MENESKYYLVLGLKGVPLCDETSEADNPYQFSCLETAFAFASKLKSTNDFLAIAEVKYIEIIK